MAHEAPFTVTVYRDGAVLAKQENCVLCMPIEGGLLLEMKDGTQTEISVDKLGFKIERPAPPAPISSADSGQGPRAQPASKTYSPYGPVSASAGAVVKAALAEFELLGAKSGRVGAGPSKEAYVRQALHDAKLSLTDAQLFAIEPSLKPA